MNYRIGQGFDLHQFADDRDLILGGIKIPYEQGLLGHSDADALCHAIIDALLGALALGDIGQHFPDNDPTKAPIVKWRSAANLLFSNWLNYFVYQTTPFNLTELSSAEESQG